MFKRRKKLTEMTDAELDQLTEEDFVWYQEHYPEDSEKWGQEVDRKFKEYVHRTAQAASWYNTDTGGQVGIVGGVENLKKDIGEESMHPDS